MSPSLRASALVTAAAVLGATLVPAPALAAEPAPAAPDLTEWVNAFVSTEDDFGQDLPGAEAPNSIVKINPMTAPGRAHSGYDYAADQIAGFTHTNLNGVGGSGGGGDLLVVPTYETYTDRPATSTYAAGFSHDEEEAEPGYYGALLEGAGDATILAEATTDVRTGQDRFTFSHAGTASIVVDLRNNFTRRNSATLDVEELPDGRVALSGAFGGHFNGYDYEMFYRVETTDAVEGVQTWGGSGSLTPAAHRDGTDIGAVLEVGVAAGEEVGLRVAVSPISAEQAEIDLAAEMGERTFDEVRADTSDAWNDILGRLAVTASDASDPDGELQTLFYTHLYRLFGMPMNATSTSGTYRGLDGAIHEADGYTHYDGWALWDDFRKYEILAIGYPEVFRDIAQSLVDLYASFADSGRGSLSSTVHAVPTVRFERAAVVIADAVAKGAELDGLADAWPALVSQSAGGYADADNVRRGYIANEVDDTLGTAYDDQAMATIAEALGRDEDAAAYRLRAANWTNLFREDAVTLADGTRSGLVFPKDAAGRWADVDPERFEVGNVYQGTLWQYNWYAAGDMGGMVDLMGGEAQAGEALSFMFGEHAPDDGSRMLHSNANEIDLQAPYLFNYVGEPAKTQYWVRNIYTKETWNRYIATGSTHEAPSSNGEFTPAVKTRVFSNSPQGFLPTMDNDAGTMSSTFVAAALGLFPVHAGSDEYQIGTPFFDNVRITYDTGRTFDITARGVTPDAFYIQDAELNGEPFDRTWVTYDQLTSGGSLVFSMGTDPSGWAADGVAPSSLSDDLPSSVYDAASAVVVSGREFTEAAAGDGSVDTEIGLTLRNGSFAGRDGEDLVASGAITASGVPDGLTLTAVREGDRAVTLALAGQAAASGTLDSVDDLVVAVSDAAFASPPSTGSRDFALKVTFDGATLRAEPGRVLATPAGVVDAELLVTLSGARFAGEAGRDLVADGLLALPGLPASISAAAEVRDASTLALTLTGDLGDAERASFALRFADEALTGTTAAALRGDGVSGLGTLAIVRDPQWRARLAELADEAGLVVPGAYAPAAFAAFDAAREEAAGVLADEGATEAALRDAFSALRRAADALEIAPTPYRLLEAEAFDAWSGGSLKVESGTDATGSGLTNLGGVLPGSWLSYSGLDFAGSAPESVLVRYVNNSGRSAADATLELRLDAPDGPLVQSIATPATASTWNGYATIDVPLDDDARDALAGSHDLYVVFEGTVGTNPWLINLDWIRFAAGGEAEEIAPVRIQAEAYTSDNGGGLAKEGTAEQGNVGGTWDGGELTYALVDLGEDPLAALTVRTSTRDERMGENPRLEFFLDGAPVAEVALPLTGGWGAWQETTVELAEPVSGIHELVVVMRADPIPGRDYQYVSNLDWYEFAPAAGAVPAVDRTALLAAIDEAGGIEAVPERYIPIDFAVFAAALADARRIAGLAESDQADVDEAARVLGLASGQLEWRPVRELPALIARAEAIDTAPYTRESADALAAALVAARATTGGADYAAFDAAVSGLRAGIAGLALAEEPGDGSGGADGGSGGDAGAGSDPGSDADGAGSDSGGAGSDGSAGSGSGGDAAGAGGAETGPDAGGSAGSGADGSAAGADGAGSGSEGAEGSGSGATTEAATTPGATDGLLATGADRAGVWVAGGLAGLLLIAAGAIFAIRRRA
ncbi:glycoside hydrolase domain-containing protein [Microbacterium sp. ZXX196]|uniref:glycoside hydrolase domain-containing protein n=1 Tax=Microbacterium sp. ZXX196 TaxID=2609291 RepID=UPI0012B83533|nr:glycoside hydrolase domain-containing protein [Microbacterium sp. ZXX196]MTE23914.1 carbohydrate-binding protein [Microbacterium sp. ZXX196]